MRYIVTVTKEDGEVLDQIHVALGHHPFGYDLNKPMGRMGLLEDIINEVRRAEDSTVPQIPEAPDPEPFDMTAFDSNTSPERQEDQKAEGQGE